MNIADIENKLANAARLDAADMLNESVDAQLRRGFQAVQIPFWADQARITTGTMRNLVAVAPEVFGQTAHRATSVVVLQAAAYVLRETEPELSARLAAMATDELRLMAEEGQ